MSAKLDVREETKPTPIYPAGSVLKLSKALRELRDIDIKYVKVSPAISESFGCRGCAFMKTDCQNYIRTACTVQERKGDKTPFVIFSPCDSKGRDL
jgi:hypothetical protein